jgi:hypothetical protein
MPVSRLVREAGIEVRPMVEARVAGSMGPVANETNNEIERLDSQIDKEEAAYDRVSKSFLHNAIIENWVLGMASFVGGGLTGFYTLLLALSGAAIPPAFVAVTVISALWFAAHLIFSKMSRNMKLMSLRNERNSLARSSRVRA